jgi:rhodanese-related sulfurtransferase
MHCRLVSAARLMQTLQRGEAPPILDVRSGCEVSRGHVPGAIHIPFWTLPLRVHEITASRDRPIVVYCGRGPRAWFAAAVLRVAGFRRVCYLKGHMWKWKRSGLPSVRRG